MTRTIERSGVFKKDYKRESKVGHKDWPGILIDVLTLLQNDRPLAPALRDHQLGGDWNGCRDLHVKPDLVLIYQKEDNAEPVLKLIRLGSHSELFKK